MALLLQTGARRMFHVQIATQAPCGVRKNGPSQPDFHSPLSVPVRAPRSGAARACVLERTFSEGVGETGGFGLQVIPPESPNGQVASAVGCTA
eukprot:7264087-Alexandrium_andersonii.AAC.1